jgi:hypothetical protein
MRRHLAIAGLTVGLLLGTGSAFAFEEVPLPPAPGAAESAPQVGVTPFRLGTEGAPGKPEDERKGINVFGYNVFPKLDFGLDVLYGQEQQQLEFQQQGGTSTLEESGGSVLGKIKRRF